MMKRIFLIILLSYSTTFLYSQSSSINLELEFTSHLLNELASKEDTFVGIEIMRYRTVTLLDTLQNELARESFWSKYGSNRWNAIIKFDQVKYSDCYIIKYEERDNLKQDTIRLNDKSENRMSIRLNENETKEVLKNRTFIDQMNPGDSLIFALGNVNNQIVIYKGDTSFSIKHIEKVNNIIKKVDVKEALSDYDLSLIKAFEYDSHRKYRTDCVDFGAVYTIKSKCETRIIQDACGEWGGYFLLKEIIFKDY